MPASHVVAEADADTAPVALVTGASQRLGAQLAISLHARGYRVVVHYHRSEGAARALCARLDAERPDATLAIAADLGAPDAPAQLVAAAAQRWDRLDVLVNNAAVFRPTPLADSGHDDWEAITGVNLRAPYFLAQAALPWLQAHQGLIVNLVDIYAERPRPQFAIYCAAKAGLIGLTRALARELAPTVRVNAIAPGAILWSSEASAAEQQAILARTPLARLGDPQDIARALDYLLDAPYVTGQVLTVDGGRSIFD